MDKESRKKLAADFGCPMNFRAYFTRGIIWGQRKIFSQFLKITDHREIPPDYVGQAANDMIRKLIASRRPCLVARFGCVELDAILRGYDIDRPNNRIMKALRMFTGGFGPFWWDNSIRHNILSTGLFPATDDTLSRFSRRSIEDARTLDVLGTWNARELELRKKFFPCCKAVALNDLDPFFFENPWSEALEGRKVLVVHPFCETIQKQYTRRKLIFPDKNVLPEFNLVVYRPVISFLGLKTPYRDWFEALDRMCADISKIDFDVALLGCGAYGMPMGAFIKRNLGRQAVHLGGATQLMFGIRGKRWDDWPMFSALYNDAWVRPREEERPSNFRQIEGGAYW